MNHNLRFVSYDDNLFILFVLRFCCGGNLVYLSHEMKIAPVDSTVTIRNLQMKDIHWISFS